MYSVSWDKMSKKLIQIKKFIHLKNVLNGKIRRLTFYTKSTFKAYLFFHFLIEVLIFHILLVGIFCLYVWLY